MKIYKVFMDLSLVLHRFKKFNLFEYQHPFPTIFVEANNPDEACHLAYHGLAAIVLKQDSSPETSTLITELFYDIVIRKVRVPT
jgi:hypothetical protein